VLRTTEKHSFLAVTLHGNPCSTQDRHGFKIAPLSLVGPNNMGISNTDLFRHRINYWLSSSPVCWTMIITSLTQKIEFLFGLLNLGLVWRQMSPLRKNGTRGKNSLMLPMH
jgi:hypothetical protein